MLAASYEFKQALSSSDLWDGFWVVNSGLNGQRNFIPGSSLDATWHTTTMYSTAFSDAQVAEMYNLTKRRFTSTL